MTTYLCSYHNHTNWSDGGESIAEVVRAAEMFDLKEVGISDHYVVHPSRDVSWSMNTEFLEAYISECKEVAADASVDVKTGLEVDFFPETFEEIQQRLAPFLGEIDYLIGSVHFVGKFPVDEGREFWDKLSEIEMNRMIIDYWELLRQAAETGYFQIIGHADLTKKFNMFPTCDISGEIAACGKAIAASGAFFEINTAGFEKPVGEAYPSEQIIKTFMEYGACPLVTADAHNSNDLIQHYDEIYRILERYGVREVPLFSAGRAEMKAFRIS